MAEQPQGRTRYDELVDKIDEMIAERIDEAIAPLIRQFAALERRVSELERPVRPGTPMEPERPPTSPLGTPEE